MAEILMKAASFVAIIAMGYCLRRAGFFKESDFGLLSKIVLKITLPAAIVTNFSKIELDPSMLGLALPGFLGGAFLILLALALNAHKSRDSRAFDILNLSGYNIGNFTMPFAQGFLGPMGVAATFSQLSFRSQNSRYKPDLPAFPLFLLPVPQFP